MGITNFHKWIVQKYPSAKVSLDKVMFTNNLFIDLNFLLHYCSYGIDNEIVLLQRIMNNITYLIDTFVPITSVVLVTDGSPPLAKLLTQRKRRILMSRKTEISSEGLNHLILTVGTKFMESLGEKLSDYINRSINKYKISIKTIFDKPNEAESNILKIINSADAKETNIIVSNDADVIVMSCASQNTNIHIANIQPGKKLSIFSTTKICDLFKKQNGGSGLDFVFLMLLMGNDYLPKLHFVKFDLLLKTYSKNKSKSTLIEQVFVDNDNDNVDVNHADVNHADDKTTKEVSYRFNMENLLDYFRSCVSCVPNGLNRKYKLSDYDPDKIKYYLEGLLWCLTNYATSTCKKYDYMYTHGPIQPLDILYFLEFNKTMVLKYPSPEYNPINKEIYPILILPKKAISLINPKYHNLIKNDKRLSFLYEEELCPTCNQLHSELSELHLKIRDLQREAELETGGTDNGVDIEYISDLVLPYKKKIGRIGSKFEKHKHTHKQIELNDIYNVVEIITNSV